MSKAIKETCKHDAVVVGHLYEGWVWYASWIENDGLVCLECFEEVKLTTTNKEKGI